mgnify:CR=1 FL=1
MTNTITKLELTRDDVAIILLAVGNFKSEMYQQGDYLMSHEASELLSKVKNGVKENV